MTELRGPELDLTRKHIQVRSGINHVCYSPYGAEIASSDVYMNLRVRRDGEVILERDFAVEDEKIRPTQRVRGLGYCQDGGVLFVAAADTLHAMESDTGVDLWTHTPRKAWGFLVISPTGLATSDTDVAASFDNGSVGVWSHDGVPRARWSSNDAPRNLAFVDEGTRLIGSDSFTLTLWDWQARKCLTRMRLPDRAYGFAVSDRHRVSATRGLHSIVLWSVDTLEPIANLPVGFGLPVMAFHPTQPLLAVGELHGVRLLDLSGNVVGGTTVNDSAVISLAFHPDGREIAIGCGDGVVRTWKQ